MKNIPSITGWFLVLLAFGLYVFGIGYGIYQSFPSSGTPVPLPDALDIMISSLGAILLTNLGAVLGISVANPSSALAKKIMPSFTNEATENVENPMNLREQLQYMAMFIYLLCLTACFICWAVKGFKSDAENVIVLIPQMGKTLIGVITAYLAFILGKQQV
jgi:hypothetical protein